MSITQFAIPQRMIAGDSVSFVRSYSDYPGSDGWLATLYLVGAGKLTTGAVPDSVDDYRFTLTSAQTILLPEGTYSAQVKVISSTETHTVEECLVTVRASLSVSATKIQHAEKMVTYIEAALEKRLSSEWAIDAQAISGRSLTLMKVNDLTALHAHYLRQLAVLKGRGRASRVITPLNVKVGRYSQ